MHLHDRRQRLVGLHMDRLIAAGIADRMLNEQPHLPATPDGCEFWVDTQPAWRDFPMRTVLLIAFPPAAAQAGSGGPLLHTMSFRAEPGGPFGAADRLPLTVAQQTLVDELVKDSVPLVVPPPVPSGPVSTQSAGASAPAVWVG